jgi:PAS domain S-box-containing protein
VSAAERLRDVRSVAALRSGEQAAISAHIARLDSVLHALLLVGLGFAALLLYRLVRQVRRDAAEKARLTERLREADANSRSIVDSAFEGIFQATPHGRLFTANKALARMYGYKSPAHLIETFSEIGTQVYLDEAERDAWVEAMGAVAGASNFEFEFVRSDGRMTWFRENVHVVRDEQGLSRYIEGTLEDISDDWWIEQRSKPSRRPFECSASQRPWPKRGRGSSRRSARSSSGIWELFGT